MRLIMAMAALVAVAVPLAPVAAQPKPGFAASATRLHAGPMRDFPSVGTVSRGARVRVFGCLLDWSWCDVAYRADRGWIMADTLLVKHHKRRILVAPDLGIEVTAFVFEPYWSSHYRGYPFFNQRQFWETRYVTDYRPEWGGLEQDRPGPYPWAPGETGTNAGGIGPQSLIVPYAFPDHSFVIVPDKGSQAKAGGEAVRNSGQADSSHRGASAQNRAR